MCVQWKPRLRSFSLSFTLGAAPLTQNVKWPRMDTHEKRISPKPEIPLLIGMLALWGLPTLWIGLKVARFAILSCLYGVGSVWSGAIRVTQTRPVIRISNGDVIQGQAHVLWGLATLVILVVVALLWLRLLILVTKGFWPSLHDVLSDIWRRSKSRT